MVFCGKNTKIMLNYQIKTQNIAYPATFLSPKRRKHSWRYKKGPAQADRSFFIVGFEITLQQQPARRLTRADYQHVTANLGNIWETL
jgi:hypothetical protein